jgi:hypothetical protein
LEILSVEADYIGPIRDQPKKSIMRLRDVIYNNVGQTLVVAKMRTQEAGG